MVAQRQNPAYRPATERAPLRGAFYLTTSWPVLNRFPSTLMEYLPAGRRRNSRRAARFAGTSTVRGVGVSRITLCALPSNEKNDTTMGAPAFTGGLEAKTPVELTPKPVRRRDPAVAPARFFVALPGGWVRAAGDGPVRWGADDGCDVVFEPQAASAVATSGTRRGAPSVIGGRTHR